MNLKKIYINIFFCYGIEGLTILIKVMILKIIITLLRLCCCPRYVESFGLMNPSDNVNFVMRQWAKKLNATISGML